MAVYAWDDQVPGACGVSALNGFSLDNGDWLGPYLKIGSKKLDNGGKLVFASFIDNEECKAAYDEMCKHYKLLYQTEPRPNKFHGNRKFFVALFEY
jgi:hypothetical protein